jgi:hypothetical protein
MNPSRYRGLALVFGLLASGMLPARIYAQDLAQSPCPAGTGFPDPRTVTQDACTQAFDVFQFVAPQLAISLAGGNAILGQSSTVGGLGHFSVGVRVNALRGLIPNVRQFQSSTQGAQRRTLPTFDQFMGLPTADAAVGIWGGFPLGIGTVGGVDVLLSASYIPTLDVEGVSIEPEKNVQIGYGARLGLLEETLVLPGVSASFLKRDLPSTDISGSYNNVTITISDAQANTTAWRLVVGKSLLIFGIAAGVGKETYDLNANASATISGFISGTATVPGTEQSLSRTNYFVDASLNLPLLKVAAEIGQVTGGTVQTYNSFEGGRADRKLTYASVGVRLGL